MACFFTCLLQETTVVVAHDIGALLFFVSGVVYIMLQSIISYCAYPFGSSITVCRVRVVTTIIATLAFIPSILSQKLKGLAIFFFLSASLPCFRQEDGYLSFDSAHTDKEEMSRAHPPLISLAQIGCW